MVTALLAVSFLTLAVTAVVPNVPAMIAAAVVSIAVEVFLYRSQRGLVAMFAKMHVDTTVRHLLRDLLIVVALVRLQEQNDESGLAAPLLVLLAFYGLHFAIQAVSVVVRRARTTPVLTRNIDTSGLPLTAAPPALLLRRPGHRLLILGLPATAGLLGAGASGEALWGVAGVGVSALAALAGLVVLGSHLLPGRRSPSEAAVLKWFDKWLAEYKPTHGMYFSGGAASAYQANMWLDPLAKLDGRPVIVLRERFMMQKITATDIPIVCLPQVHHLMRLEHSTLQALIHPSNSGKTSQVLRIPTIKHTFVNHGESDKLSSCNPYAKAYDEVWVAGPEARERYALADVGVEDKDIVEIGRPQLDGIVTYKGAPQGEYTDVLYAPTWEGWDGNPGNTSVVAAGENLVRALLADPKVRLVYKPHPLTGSVDPRAGAADLRIRELILAANRRRTGPRPGPEAVAELARRTAELDRLTTSTFRESADNLERMMLQTAPEPGRAAAVTAATSAWVEAYWAALPEWEHQIVTDARPDIQTCFNRADLLISDVSSVISDYMASGKPYAVANTSGLSETAFREAFPTVRAATVLTPDATGVPALLERVRDPELDDLQEARAELKLRLLGPSEPPSQVRFNEAMRALCESALQHRRRMTEREAHIPGQRAAAPSGDPELTTG
ncbi:hypothetical protein ABT026_13865 [Streptomyces sp. NPDC002734]|uniref:hypothetical protein n=1 Tax=Streptomyces sp. NPDC002734 TaxID=3154426 RepID=UPI003333A121